MTATRPHSHLFALGAAAIVLLACALAIGSCGGKGGRTSGGESAGARAKRGAHPHRTRGDLAAAAAYLGTTPERLRGELRGGRTLAQIASASSGRSAAGLIAALEAARMATLTAAVATGAITPTQERARLRAVPTRVTAIVNRLGAYATTAHVGRLQASDVPVAASYLGLPADRLLAEFASGRSAAAIAREAGGGRSPAGLVAALLAAHRARLDARVGDGTLTPTREARLLAHLGRRLSIEVLSARRS